MTALKNFKISFLHCGHANAVYVVASSLHEADVWKHLADRLGLFYCDSEGYTMLSHSIKKMVEGNDVTHVEVEELELFDLSTQSSQHALMPLDAETGAVFKP